MKIEAHRTTGAGRTLLLSRGATQTTKEGEFLGKVSVLLVTAVNDHNGRPSVHLVGEVNSLQVGEDTVELKNGLLAMWEYQFTRPQLTALTDRGLLEYGLGESPFGELVGCEMELPLATQLSMLSLDNKDYLFADRLTGTGVPLITVDSCGYDLVDFFAAQPEINPLEVKAQAERDRQNGYEGVDMLFEDEPTPTPVVARAAESATKVRPEPFEQIAAQPGTEGLSDFVEAALRLSHTDGDSGPVETLPGPEGTPEALVAPKTDFLDEWFRSAPSGRHFITEEAGDHADPEQLRVQGREEREEQADKDEAAAGAVVQEAHTEEARKATERGRIAQGLGHIPSAYLPNPDSGPIEDFDALEL